MGQSASVLCMGQMEFRAERNEAADDALWTGFTVGATEDQVRYAMNTARERLASAENAQHLVVLQAIRALSTRGLSVREIAGVVGISKSAVSRHLRMGIDGVAVRQVDEVTAIVRHAWGRER